MRLLHGLPRLGGAVCFFGGGPPGLDSFFDLCVGIASLFKEPVMLFYGLVCIDYLVVGLLALVTGEARTTDEERY